MRFLDAARLGARFLLEDCRDAKGRLQRTWKDGVAKIPSFLEDEAFLAHALLDLDEADDEGGPGVWRSKAVAAVASMRARFRRADGPGFAFSGDGNETLLVNGRDLFDKATPSASGSAAWALARLALRTGDRELAREARDAVEEVSGFMARSPHGTESWYFALEALFEFEDKHGLLPSADAGEVLQVSFPSKYRAVRGTASRLVLTIQVKDGWHLQGPDGLRIEVSGGSGSEFTFEEILLPLPSRLPDSTRDDETGWHGTFEANLSFLLSPSAMRGTRDVNVKVRYLACGEGACRPEGMLCLTVPVEVD